MCKHYILRIKYCKLRVYYLNKIINDKITPNIQTIEDLEYRVCNEVDVSQQHTRPNKSYGGNIKNLYFISFFFVIYFKYTLFRVPLGGIIGLGCCYGSYRCRWGCCYGSNSCRLGWYRKSYAVLLKNSLDEGLFICNISITIILISCQ